MSLVDNLKLLCGHYESIADVARKTGINRTQFNKYLSGQVKPSRANIRIICDFFGVEEFEIMMPHDQFRTHILPDTRPAADVVADPFFHKVMELRGASTPSLKRYLGWYFEYYFSLGYPGKVFKSLIHISEDNGGLQYKRYERLIPASSQGEPVPHCLYNGVVINMCDRIYMLDVESLTENEITQTVLFPSYRSQIRYLHGLKLGVSSRSHRNPACTRVLFEHLGEEINFRSHFRRCGLYAPSDLPTQLLEQIENRMDEDAPLFYAKEV